MILLTLMEQNIVSRTKDDKIIESKIISLGPRMKENNVLLIDA